MPEILERNEAKLSSVTLNLLGKPFQQLRQETKLQLIDAANRYLSECGFESCYADPVAPVILSGHQPALFHPGVWVKNFAVSKIAEQTSGTALNLIIDNDSSSPVEFSFPTLKDNGLKGNELTKSRIMLDSSSPAKPWEELSIQDRELVHSFADRAEQQLSHLGIKPVLSKGWETAIRRADETDNLAEAVSAARIKVEREWGVQNLELPISRLSLEPSFLWFSLHLMLNLTRFQQVYNQVLAEHRKRNGIRNAQHPVPDLQVDGEWLEAPFWIWKEGDEQRKHLWVKYQNGVLAFSCGKKTTCEIPCRSEEDAESVVAALQALYQEGVRFRPRALTTTLFTRLFLGELFVHGIGGAKYDEVTDELIEKFYQIEPPQYLALSGTIFLPTNTEHSVTQEEFQQLKGLLRELKQQPARHLTAQQQQDYTEMLKERELLLQEQVEYKKLTKREKKALADQNSTRFQRLKQINDKLTTATQPQQTQLNEEINRLDYAWEQKQIAENREYPAMFYPADKLQALIGKCTKQIENAFARKETVNSVCSTGTDAAD